MKNKKISVLAIILILNLIFSSFAYAIDAQNSEEENVFEVEKTSLSPGDIINMYINLEKIEYDNFKFILSANFNTEDIEIDKTQSSEENISTENEEQTNDLVLTSNKQILNTNKIGLLYYIPEKTSIGTTLKITAIIMPNEEEYKQEDVITQEVEINIVEEQQVDDSNKEENKDEDQIKDEITENETYGNQQNNQSVQNTNTQANQEEVSNKLMQTTQTQETSNSVSNSSEMQSSTKVLTSQEETVTYNGSSNNYLSGLSIDGVTLNKEFVKTSSTYFAKVDTTVNSLTINADAEDETSSINVYGNDNLNTGTNKILISVTSENGNVRVYRVFVTKS